MDRKALTVVKTEMSRDDYVAKKRKQLDAWNAEVSAFEASAIKAKSDVNAKFHKQILAARKNYEDSSKKLDAVKKSADVSWEGLKAETENVFAAFKDSVDQFKAHF
jgi:inorganic pyrophosphatase